MSTQNRRSSFSSSTSSSLAKRNASSSSSENMGKATLAKKRAPLSNLTNVKNVANVSSRSSIPYSALVSSASKIAKAKKGPPANTGSTGLPRTNFPASLNLKSTAVVPCSKVTSFSRSDGTVPNSVAIPAQFSMDVSPSKSDGLSVSLDESMSTCDSFKSPEVEYMDNSDVPAVDSIERKTFGNLYISDLEEKIGNICNRDILAAMETDDKIVNIDKNYTDPQLCAAFACDIYKHLRASEAKKRPSTDFMERVQKDINASMRAILIDWLVEVAEEYRLVPDTLYLTVNYIDRYLSGNVMNRQRLQLLGVACMMIASKYEEICAPQVEEFCYITDNTYFKEEVLQMESAVLNFLKFEMTAPTTKCFLRRFVRAAQGINEVPSLQLECLANYIAELSLLEYNMLCYAPSLLAASAIFMAKYILFPSQKPWNSTLQHYTIYKPSDLCNCVKDLHRLCCDSHTSSLPAIKEKYSQHKYKYVAKKYCPPTIPAEFFQN
ncbi:cyclin-A1-1-like [Juglans microcarpa x Juglans regia]|uniref:cyclin-A1-1-like n=1 Tax=Juglans microcarpa x Juglans regia TaxID=2249226 RepID=UPI001B7D9549|nr:cyclin-A1-1-like [Juglans microcarpa x Juglans regia]